MQLYNALAIITVLAALFGYINHRFIRLPHTIGVMLISLVASLGVVILGLLEPSIFQQATAFIRRIDFYTVLVKIMLGFMLFAGAINLNGRALNNERVSVLTFSTISVLLSTALVGGLLYLLCLVLHQPIPFVYCLLFGALISPTDPIAVLSILREAGISPSLEIKITGESLFNDGVIDKFWGMTDNLLNAVLFLLIGLEMLVIPFRPFLLWLGLGAIPIVLAARYVSVLLPISLLRYNTCFEKNAIGILTWGGLRGGLSVALALSVPASMYGEHFVAITYIIVLFSIIVQGLTIGKFAGHLI